LHTFNLNRDMEMFGGILYHLLSILELGIFICAFLGLFPLARELKISFWFLILPFILFSANNWIYAMDIFSENGLLHFMLKPLL